ncbi:hypothetical protein GQ457_18G000850 [Hibiscus cannabinus]
MIHTQAIIPPNPFSIPHLSRSHLLPFFGEAPTTIHSASVFDTADAVVFFSFPRAKPTFLFSEPSRRSGDPSPNLSASFVSSLRRRLCSVLGFGSEAEVLPSPVQFDRARTSRLARNLSSGPSISERGRRASQ